MTAFTRPQQDEGGESSEIRRAKTNVHVGSFGKLVEMGLEAFGTFHQSAINSANLHALNDCFESFASLELGFLFLMKRRSNCFL